MRRTHADDLYHTAKAYLKDGDTDLAPHLESYKELGGDESVKAKCHRATQLIISPETLSVWRLGDDLPFNIQGTVDEKRAQAREARHRNHQIDPNQGKWRMGDTRPFRIDGSIPAPAAHGNGAAHSIAAAHSNTAAPIDQLYDGAVAAARGGFGPRAGAAVLSDTTGLTWAEMRRTGLLQRSASDAVIQPARISQW